MATPTVRRPPAWWPHLRSPLRTTAVTARVGRVLGICFGVCFVTGMLSHYQYHPWSWLPEPAVPVWGYRLTQGLHVVTGTAAIPLLLVKLWSVYPNLFHWPPAKSVKHAAERFSVAILVASALVELFTGFFNSLDWYPWSWDFVPVHRFLGYVVVGSILLHISIKLPAIRAGLRTRLTAGPPATGVSRRGLLVATGAGVGLVVVTSAGETLTPLRPVNLLAIRETDKGPQRVPVNRTVAQAGVGARVAAAKRGDWSLDVTGPHPYVLGLAELEAMATHEASFPISCVEGWSVGAQWRGVRLLDVVERAGGNTGSRVKIVSLERRGSYNYSYVAGPQLSHALLATHLNGTRLDPEHGYPLRLIAPDRAGVLNTKWLASVEIVG